MQYKMEHQHQDKGVVDKQEQRQESNQKMQALTNLSVTFPSKIRILTSLLTKRS